MSTSSFYSAAKILLFIDLCKCNEWIFKKILIFMGMEKKKLIRLTESDVHRIVKECVRIVLTEDYHNYDGFMEKYGANYIFTQFLSRESDRMSWTPLIKKDMYAKALREFMQYGKLINFPEKVVFQWMGIIMKNTAMLAAATELFGHSQSFPIEECEDFLVEWFDGKRMVCVEGYNSMFVQIFPYEIVKLAESGTINMNEAIDCNGQQYFDFVSQEDVDRLTFEKMAAQYKELIYEYNDKYGNADYSIDVDYEQMKFYWRMPTHELLESIGFYDWLVTPDDTYAISDYGLNPLIKVIMEYNESMTAEQTLVIVNKALDITHPRGDLSSVFIEDGWRTLDYISGK